MITAGAPHEFCPFGKTLLSFHPQDNGFNTNSGNHSLWACAETETSRDLFRALSAFTLKEESSKERWTIRRNEEEEVELYSSGNVVILSRSDSQGFSHLIKTYTLQNNVQQALFTCYMDTEEDKQIHSVTTLDSNNLTIHSQDGNFYPLGLPFQISRLFAGNTGLIIEREPLPNEMGGTVPLPIVFSLLHPLKDITPVVIKNGPQNLSYFSGETKLEIVDVCQEWSVCLMYHKTEGVHSLWSIRSATDQEVQFLVNESFTSSGTHNESLTGSPYTGSGRQPGSFSALMASSESPLRSAGTSKSTLATNSTSSPPSSLSQAKAIASSSSYLSPLRSSRLGASPGSPLMRGFSPVVESIYSKIVGEKPLPSTTIYSSSPHGSTPRRKIESDLADDTDDPIYPEVVFECRWTEPHSASGKASKFFFTRDLMGQNYYGYLLSSQQQLKLLKFDESNDKNKLILGTLNFIPAKDAEPVESLNMILVLDLSCTFVLYSGVYKVTVVHIPPISLFSHDVLSHSLSKSFQSPNRRVSLKVSSRPPSSSGLFPRFSNEGALLSPVCNVSFEESQFASNNYLLLTNITGIKCATGDKIIIETNEISLFRFSLPPVNNSETVTLCLNALKAVLPKDVSMQLFIKWYCIRNALGSADLSDLNEISLFKYCILTACGYDVSKCPLDINLAEIGLSDRSPSSSKKVKLESPESGTDDDWLALISDLPSDYHDHEESFVVNTSALLFPYLASVLYSLHLVHEELLLNTLMTEQSDQFCNLLHLLATDMNLLSYQDYYWRNHPNVLFPPTGESRIPLKELKSLQYPAYFTEIPPSIFQHVKCIMKKDFSTPFPFISGTTKLIRNVVLLYRAFYSATVSERDCLVLIPHSKLCTVENSIFSSDNNVERRLVTCMKWLDVKQSTLLTFPAGLVLPLWDAIFKSKHRPPADWDSKCYQLIGRPDLLALSRHKRLNFPVSRSNCHDMDAEDDGINGLNKEVLKLLFPDDQRVYEAYNMLQSSKPVKICLQQRPGVTDHDFIEEQERHLYTVCIRTMALPVGRGMFTLKTYKPVVAETFPIPKLCLSGRVPPRNTAVDLAHIDLPPNMNTWPMFHNGVAAGLRASPSSSETINSAWIIYNKPKITSQGVNDSQNEHAGFLLGLGLNNHLTKLSMMHIHDYLCKGNELTRVAVLLGLAAAKRGTMDMFAFKILSIHIEALLPPTSTELDVPPVVQVAAVLGIGLVYQSSGQNHIAEVLLGEIGRPPGPEMEHYIDRESYALASGLALGLVTLGKGNEMISIVSSTESISMADQLCNYMIGGHKRPLTNVQREKYKTPSYQIREGDYVNADVTSPGATLALGMMFFNTGNEAIASWVTAPDTQYLLETVRPDFLMLRVLCKGLIMWSDVRPTKAWIDSHVPEIVARNALTVDVDYDSIIDYETMAQAYCNIIAGACMVLGLKYAGSSNQQAFESVMGYTKMFLDFPKDVIYAERAGRSTIESCLNVLVVSLAMIMAGTGNVKVMRICRYLRSRISQVNVVLYGSHMATHMALGLLFLGGCRYTLSTSPEAIAALICAFFPKYPIHSNDNRYHLQAFRHLYVLATEPRLVIPRDVDTGHFVFVHLTLKYTNQKGQQRHKVLKAPCFLPELRTLDEVIVQDDRYWEISFNRRKNWVLLSEFLTTDGVLYVKQKVGYLPYEKDAQGYKSIHAQCVMKDAVKGWNFQPTSLNEFSSDPILVNLANYLLIPRAKIYNEAILQQHLCRVLFDCASNETVEMLPVLMYFLKIIHSWDVNFRTKAYDLSQVKLLMDVAPLCSNLRKDFLESLASFIEKRAEGISSGALLSYFKSEQSLRDVDKSVADLLLLYDMPPYSALSALKGKMTFASLTMNLKHFNLSMKTLLFLSKLFVENR